MLDCCSVLLFVAAHLDVVARDPVGFSIPPSGNGATIAQIVLLLLVRSIGLTSLAGCGSTLASVWLSPSVRVCVCVCDLSPALSLVCWLASFVSLLASWLDASLWVDRVVGSGYGLFFVEPTDALILARWSRKKRRCENKKRLLEYIEPRI